MNNDFKNVLFLNNSLLATVRFSQREYSFSSSEAIDSEPRKYVSTVSASWFLPKKGVYVWAQNYTKICSLIKHGAFELLTIDSGGVISRDD